MTAYFTLTLDTQPPANPGILLNSGASVTGAREIAVALSSTDYQGGARDTQMMRIWGDVDPTADPFVQTTEAASTWQTFETDYVVRLSDLSGRKTVSARLKDDVCNESVSFSATIALDLDSPVVAITTAVDRSRISKVAPCNTALFLWQANRDFVRYEVRVVPNPGSPHVTGVAIGTTNGSSNVVGIGSYQAFDPITTVINGADLEAASPGDTAKCVKIFVQDSNGVWSS